MKIGVVMVAYNNAGAIRRLFESAVTYSYEVEYHLFLHSQQADVVAVCENISSPPSPLSNAQKQVISEGERCVHYYPYGGNRGLAKSWNEGILNAYANGCQTVIVVNDDVEFATGDLAALADFALLQQEYYIVTAQGWHLRHHQHEDMGFSCFAINPIALEKIGCFDENFFPIYFEDCDYAYRALRLGLKRGFCELTRVKHGGSQSIKQEDADLMAQHHLTFTRNKEYYLRKWGGEPHFEKYDFPFGESGYGFMIAPEHRDKPYGEFFDRTDREIVKR